MCSLSTGYQWLSHVLALLLIGKLHYSRELLDTYTVLNSSFLRFKFDDERVTKEDAKRALEEQYGGEEEV